MIKNFITVLMQDDRPGIIYVEFFNNGMKGKATIPAVDLRKSIRKHGCRRRKHFGLEYPFYGYLKDRFPKYAETVDWTKLQIVEVQFMGITYRN